MLNTILSREMLTSVEILCNNANREFAESTKKNMTKSDNLLFFVIRHAISGQYKPQGIH